MSHRRDHAEGRLEDTRALRPDIRDSASETLVKLLEALSLFCLQHGFGKSEVEEAFRRTLVSQAVAYCSSRNVSTSVSRLAVITGLSRKRVRELLDTSLREPLSSQLPPGRLVKLVDIWQTSPSYLDEEGLPKPLQIGSPNQEGSFSALARDAAGDIPPTTLLRELVRMGAVEKTRECVSLVSSRLLPKPGDSGVINIQIAGDAITDFLSTINNNLDPNAPRAFERRVVGEGLSRTDMQEFSTYAESLADSLLEELNSWVLERKKNSLSEKAHDKGQEFFGRTGLGVYLFEDPQGEK